MNAKVEAPVTAPRLDTLKLGVALLVLGVAIVGFYLYAEAPLVVRVLALIAAAAVAAWIAYQTQRGKSVWSFALESRNEVRKVVWPTRQETLQATLAVFVMVLVVGVGLWLVDMFLLWAVKLVTGQGG